MTRAPHGTTCTDCRLPYSSLFLSDPVPLEHVERGIVAAAGFAVAEHAAEFVAIAETGGEQALERILGRGAQPARARPAVGAAGEFERERRDVRLGVAGLRHDRRLDLEHAALGKEFPNRRVERSGERRLGKEGVRQGKSWLSPYTS